ncbi:hypothetical protein LUZ60_005110 [Juncus effusus]|nr:hypothetical protein LUZ60_005110 [Juncus effusus]
MEEERPWQNMDIDCLLNIFRLLDLQDITLFVPFVCSSWYRVSLDPICYQVLDFRKLDFMPWSHFSKDFSLRFGLSQPFSLSGFLKLCVARSHGLVMEICFPPLLGMALEDLTYISYECPKLTKLVLPNMLSEHEPHLPEIIGRWPELKQLEMEAKPSSFQGMINKISTNCMKFVGLKLSGSFKSDDVSAMVNRLPKVKQLFLSKSFLRKEELLTILNGCKCLEELIVRECVGFEICEEDLKMVSGQIRIFEHEGSRLVGKFDYDTDECDPQHVLVI